VSAFRQGDEVVVQWVMQEQFPNPAKSRLEYRTANMPANVWNPAPLPFFNPTEGRASWRPGNDYAMSVRVHIQDLAGPAAATPPQEPRASPPPTGGATASVPVAPAPFPTPAPGAFPPPRAEANPYPPPGAVVPAAPAVMQRTVPDPSSFANPTGLAPGQ